MDCHAAPTGNSGYLFLCRSHVTHLYHTHIQDDWFSKCSHFLQSCFILEPRSSVQTGPMGERGCSLMLSHGTHACALQPCAVSAKQCKHWPAVNRGCFKDLYVTWSSTITRHKTSPFSTVQSHICMQCKFWLSLFFVGLGHFWIIHRYPDANDVTHSVHRPTSEYSPLSTTFNKR